MMDRRQFIRSSAWGLLGLGACAQLGCRSNQTAQVVNPGDKTMVDALVPAVEALRQAADQGSAPAEMLARAAAAAQQGAQGTRELQARFGRARNLGPRTIGHVDPGATSISLLLAGFRDGLSPPTA